MLVIITFLPDRHCNINAHKLNFFFKEIWIPLEHFSKSSAALVAPHQWSVESDLSVADFCNRRMEQGRDMPRKIGRTLLIFKIYFIKLAQRQETCRAGATREGASDINSLTLAHLIHLPKLERKWRKLGNCWFAVWLHFDCSTGTLRRGLVIAIKSEMVRVVSASRRPRGVRWESLGPGVPWGKRENVWTFWCIRMWQLGFSGGQRTEIPNNWLCWQALLSWWNGASSSQAHPAFNLCTMS